MTIKCPKCEYVRKPTDTAPDYECPECGIIYAKFDPDRDAENERRRHNLSVNKTSAAVKSFPTRDTVGSTGSTEQQIGKDEKCCSECGEIIRRRAEICPKCGVRQSDSVSQNKLKQIIGYAGALLLCIGVFTPILSVPFAGNVNLFQNGKGDGAIVLGLAIVSFILIFVKQYRLIWLTGLGSLGIVIFDFIGVMKKIDEAKNVIISGMENNPFAAIPAIMANSIQLQWGWVILFAGAILLVVCVVMRK